ncbi:helix-turn-helix domain-containing protein [Aquamicrobium segne]|uniref:Helix-turn-helix domain-containing protein n=1 Tax=Aquamicrobium segne TaxID=469547 RepID=A0ABW0GXW2_9HYPH
MTHHHLTDPSADTLGGRISLAREFTGLSAAQAARRLGVLTSSWNAWECDRSEPRGNRLAMMAGLLGVSPTWLFSGIGNAPQEHNDRESTKLLQELHHTSESIAVLNKRVQQLISGFEGLYSRDGFAPA